MVSIDDIDIDIDVDVSGLAQVSQLSTQLKELAASQRLVNDDMTIDVDARLSGRLSQLLDGGLPDGGITDGGGLGGGSWRRRSGMSNTQLMSRSVTTGGARGIDTIFDRLNEATETFRYTLEDTNSISEVLNLNMSQFYSILAGLLPMLIAMIAALPAMIAAFGTVAAAALSAAVALGGIGALGALGLAQQRGDSLREGLKSLITDLRESIIDDFEPVFEQFSDLGEMGFEGLKELSEDVAEAASELSYLRDDAEAFGGYLLDNIPALISMFGQLTEAFSPILSDFGEWLESAGIMEGFVDVTEDALPPLMVLIDSFLSMLPVLTRLSVGFLWVTAAIFKFWDAFWSILDVIPGFVTGLGIAIGAMLTLISVVATTAAMYKAFSVLMGSNVVSAILNYIAVLKGATLAELNLATATQILAGAMTTLKWAIPGGALLVLLGSIANKFMGITGSVGEATDAMREFGDVQSNLGGTDMGSPYAPEWTGLDRSAQTAVRGDTSVTVNNYGGENGRTDKQIDKAMYISRGMRGN